MISFNGDIVGYLASSQTNLHPPQKHTKSSSHNTATRSPERNRSQIRSRSNKPRQVGINGDSIHRQTTAHHAGHSLQLLNLPPDLVRHSLHETVRLHEHTHTENRSSIMKLQPHLSIIFHNIKDRNETANLNSRMFWCDWEFDVP